MAWTVDNLDLLLQRSDAKFCGSWPLHGSQDKIKTVLCASRMCVDTGSSARPPVTVLTSQDKSVAAQTCRRHVLAG